MEYLLNHCSVSFFQHGSLLASLFLAGLVGGFTHCAGMCGPFVMSQMENKFESTTLADTSVLKRLQGAALLPYHLGRMTSYAVLGAIAAFLSKQIIGSPTERWVAAILLTLAGLMFVASAVPYLKARMFKLRSKNFSKFGALLSRLARPLVLKPNMASGYGLGVLLGFLPCGLVFAALMMVAVTASPITAVFGMMLFTVGTFPALFSIGFFSQYAFRRWPVTARQIAHFVMLINGLSLFAMAGNIVL